MIMQSIGVKELKNRLTHYLKLVRNGDQVIVTERGNPIAILHGLEKVELTDSAEEKLAALAARGLVRLPLKWTSLPRIKAVKATGIPASRIIVEERR
jgi:prevent-host-death family protein